MRVTIRTTAGGQIGYGHLRRCRTLADALERDAHADVTFLLTGTAPAGFPGAVQTVTTLEEVARRECDLIVLDDYALSDRDFSTLRSSCTARLAAIDDLALRRCGALDFVINPSAGIDASAYDARSKLLGPAYALLRPAFVGLPPRTVRPNVERVLVSLGGADPHNDTPGVARAVRSALAGAQIIVLLGPLFDAANVTALETWAHLDGNAFVRRNVEVAQLMLDADLAVCAGGQTVFELCAAGLPALAIEVADNQRHNLASLTREGTLLATTREALTHDARRVAEDAQLRQRMAAAGQRLVDGRGAERVARALKD